MGSEKRWGCRLGNQADQVRRLVFLVSRPTQALQSHIDFWQLFKNALKAEACLFLWNETCSCCKILWHKKKKLDRRQLEEGSNAYTLKFFTRIQRILPFRRLFFFPLPRFFHFQKCYILPSSTCPLLARGIYMANVPISSLGWKVSYSTLKSVWFRNGSLRQRWAATCGGWRLAFSGFKRRVEAKEYQGKEEGESTCKY